MMNELTSIIAEKINSMVEKILPEKERMQEKRDIIKNFGINCIHMGYELHKKIKEKEEEWNNFN